MAFLDEIALKWVADGVGTIAQTIFLSSRANIPKGDGPFLSAVETGGTGAARTQTNATERPTAQVVARAASYPAARALLKAAYDSLGGANGLYNLTLSGTKYVRIVARQKCIDIGPDGDGRAMVAFNIDAEKQPS